MVYMGVYGVLLGGQMEKVQLWLTLAMLQDEARIVHSSAALAD